MASTFSVGGLISGLDSATLIKQLVSIERQPINRIEKNIDSLKTQKDAIKALRTQLLALRNKAQDFKLSSVFNSYEITSSEEDVMTAEVAGSSPVVGSYRVEVLKLASATTGASSGTVGSPINTTSPLVSSGMASNVSAGKFTINGVTLTIDPTTQSLSDVLTQINNSAAGVTATYDATSDRVTFENKNAGNTSIINFGSTDDDSNFLTVIAMKNANQATGVNGSTTAASTRNLGAVDASASFTDARFVNGAVTAGNFYVNGVEITVDPTTDSLSDVLQRITDSDAGVSASYDSATDKILFVSKNLGSRTIGLTAGTSNFLNITKLDTAVQTAGNDAQFSVNGGPVQTRNTNQVDDAIGGLSLNLLSEGTTTLTIASDDDAIVKAVQGFVDAFNESVAKIEELVGSEGDLAGDGSIRTIQTYMREMIFSQVSGVSGDFASLVDIGVSTGDSFDSESISKLSLDTDKFKEALRDNRANVRNLFNNSDSNGISDKLFAYMDEVTKFNGFLNARAKSNGSIDTQVNNLNDQIGRLEDHASKYEERLKNQFNRLEQLSLSYKTQGSAISSLGSSLF